MSVIYIGIGSNLGERSENLKHAVKNLDEIPDIDITGKSSIMETEPVDFLDQPDFFNQVVRIETDLNPLKLLKVLKNIETEMGRTYESEKGPRNIDLDILLYNDRVIDMDILKIPHPSMLERDFVLSHLVEIDPDITHPVTGVKLREVLTNAGN